MTNPYPHLFSEITVGHLTLPNRLMMGSMHTNMEGDDDGLHITIAGEAMCLEVDTVVICAGQEENATLAESLAKKGLPRYVIGGASQALELDAMRAIEEGMRLAAEL